MHGLLFATFVEFSRDRLGVALAGEPEYAADAEYPDEEFAALLARAVDEAGADRDEVLRAFGRHTALTTFPALYPDYYAGHTSVRAFLLGVESQIHEVVRSTIRFARPPRLRVLPFGELGVAISYTSERRLCTLLHGLVEGVAEHYGEVLDVSQSQCMHRGDIGCAFFVAPADGSVPSAAGG